MLGNCSAISYAKLRFAVSQTDVNNSRATRFVLCLLNGGENGMEDGSKHSPEPDGPDEVIIMAAGFSVPLP